MGLEKSTIEERDFVKRNEIWLRKESILTNK